MVGKCILACPFTFHSGCNSSRPVGLTFLSLVAQMVKHLPAMQEIRVQSLGQEDPLEKGNGSPLQYPCLENSMDGGAWWATVHGVAKSWT